MARDKHFSLKSLSLGILYFLLFFAPLAIGGVHDFTLIAVALLSFFVLFFYLIDRHLKDKHFFISWFFYLFAAYSLFVFSQIIPLPDFIVSLLSPKSAEIYRDSAVANGLEPPAFHPISTAPYRTVMDFIKIAGSAFLFLGVMNLSRREARARRILRAVCYSAGAVFLIGLLHFWTGAEEILWFYKPQKDLTQSLFFTTFVNENNLAGFMNLAFFLCVGFLFDRQGKHNRAFFFLLAISCLLAVIFSSSRGGLSSLTAGAVIFAVFYAAGRLKGTRETGSIRYLIIPALLAMFAFFVLFYFMYESLLSGVRKEIFLTEEIRATLLRHSLPVIGDFPFVGSGKGSFAFVFPQYFELTSPKRFVHLENAPLQLIIECGIPFGVLFIAAASGLFASLFLKVWRAPLKLGALTGVIATCLASLADFALEYAGTATALITVIGAICGLDLRRQIHETNVVEKIVRPQKLVPVFTAIFILTAVFSALLLYSYSGREHSFNPADCESFLVRGNNLLNAKMIDQAEPLLKRSRELCPTYFSNSLAYAKLLIHRNDIRGAGEEIKRILENYPTKNAEVFDSVFSARNKPFAYARLFVDEGHSIQFFDYLRKKGMEDYAEGFLLEKLKLHNTSETIAAALARFYVETDRMDKASQFAERLYTSESRKPEGAYLMGVVLKKQGRVFEAFHILIEALRRYKESCGENEGDRCPRLGGEFNMELLIELIDTSITLKEDAKAEEFLEKMRNKLIEKRYYLMKYRQLSAALFSLRGEYTRAFGELEVALKLSPDNSGVLLQYAELCEKVGNLTDAILYYNKLLAKGKRFEWVKERIEKLKRNQN